MREYNWKVADKGYYDNLPKKYMAGGVLVCNAKGEILVLKTTYKDGWEIPGGGVEKDESPKQAARREAKEELGLDIEIGDLLVMDHWPAIEPRGDNLMFVFDGGVVEENDLVLDKGEISEARFVPLSEAVKLLGERLRERIVIAVKAKQEQRMICLGQGKEE